MQKRFYPFILIALCLFIYGFSSQVTPNDAIFIQQSNSMRFNEIMDYIDQNEYEYAINSLEKLNNYDMFLTSYNKDKFDKLISEYKKILITDANQLIKEQEYQIALNLLNSKVRYYSGDGVISNLILLCTNMISRDNLIPYKDKIPVLAFNPILSFPTNALSVDNMYSTEHDKEHITPTEYEKILHELYVNNYVLVSACYVFGDTTLKPLYLPKNKKPIILMLENAYFDKKHIGLIDKVILDRNGEIATYTSKKSVHERVDYENDFITILESFVQKNPEFSHESAKGLISINGSLGILGYKTQKNNSTSSYEINKAKKVISKLLSTGWCFAGASYNNIKLSTSGQMDTLKEFTKWINDVQPIISKTKLYNLHAEENLKDIKDKLPILKENGFTCLIIANNENVKYNNLEDNDLYILKKLLVNGQNLRENSAQFIEFFSAENVYDNIHRLIPYKSMNALY